MVEREQLAIVFVRGLHLISRSEILFEELKIQFNLNFTLLIVPNFTGNSEYCISQ